MDIKYSTYTHMQSSFIILELRRTKEFGDPEEKAQTQAGTGWNKKAWCYASPTRENTRNWEDRPVLRNNNTKKVEHGLEMVKTKPLTYTVIYNS